MTLPKERFRFRFAKQNDVYWGELELRREKAPPDSSLCYVLAYNLMFSQPNTHRWRYVIVTEDCYRDPHFDWNQLPTLVVRAFRRIDASKEKFVFTGENTERYLPVYTGMTVDKSACIIAEQMKTFLVEGNSEWREVDDLRVSSGLDNSLFDKAMSHLCRRGIISVIYTGDPPHTYDLAQEGLHDGLEKLYSLLDGCKKSPFDFATMDHKYFHEYSHLPDGVDEPFVFVLMPFKETEFPQKFYSERLKPLVEGQFDRLCVRVDEDRLTRGVMDKIASYIRDAELVVAEISTLNPNVMYELGLAHAMDKETVVLWNQQLADKKRPFDVNHYTLTDYTDTDFDDVVGAIEAVLK